MTNLVGIGKNGEKCRDVVEVEDVEIDFEDCISDLFVLETETRENDHQILRSARIEKIDHFG